MAETFLRLRDELCRLTPLPGDYQTPIHGLTLYRRECPCFPDTFGFAEPHVTMVFQGSEEVLTANGEILVCAASQSRVIGAEIPGAGYIAAATPENPFLALSFCLNRDLIASLAATLTPLQRCWHDTLRGMSVARAEPGVVSAFFRLARLLHNTAHIPYLAPMIVWEIHYRLLIGPHGQGRSALFNDQ